MRHACSLRAQLRGEPSFHGRTIEDMAGNMKRRDVDQMGNAEALNDCERPLRRTVDAPFTRICHAVSLPV